MRGNIPYSGKGVLWYQGESDVTDGEAKIYKTVDIEIPDSAINISADKKELKRAITNLITNTYKHNPSGIL